MTPKRFEISITVTRHGPKQSLGGPLSDEGRALVQKQFSEMIRSIEPRMEIRRIIFTSPIHRALETAQIYKNIIDNHFSVPEQERLSNLIIDERLSEKNLVDFIDQLSTNKKEDWFRHWYTAKERLIENVQSRTEAVSAFAHWLIERIKVHGNEGGIFEINAFSHGPVMAAFILRLEELMRISILGNNAAVNNFDYESEKVLGERLKTDKLFANTDGVFQYLSSMKFHADSEQDELLKMYFGDSEIQIPIQAITELAAEN